MKDLSNHNVLISFLVLLLLNGPFILAQHESSGADYISLGLLVNKQNEAAAVCAASLAIEEVNENGGIQGKSLKLIVRSVEGSWGAGSREVVDLVFKEEVMAIIGSIDGRNAHLAEQVIAKTQVTYVSAWATDPSLSKAYVPWYFSAVPTDDQQAELILKEIAKKKGSRHILVIHDDSYDAQQALKSIYQDSNKVEDLMISTVIAQSLGSKDLLPIIADKNLDAVILLGRQIPFSSISKQLDISGKNIPVYANLAAQSSVGFTNSQFEKEFLHNCNANPGPVAAYTFDAIMIISEALKQSGNDRGRLQKSMSQINYQGVTGTVQFDSHGRLKNTGELLLTKE